MSSGVILSTVIRTISAAITASESGSKRTMIGVSSRRPKSSFTARATKKLLPTRAGRRWERCQVTCHYSVPKRKLHGTYVSWVHRPWLRRALGCWQVHRCWRRRTLGGWRTIAGPWHSAFRVTDAFTWGWRTIAGPWHSAFRATHAFTISRHSARLNNTPAPAAASCHH